jgi:hypothetical protein
MAKTAAAKKRATTKRAVQVTSTCLRTVKHDPDKRRLELEFRQSGARYAYFGVSPRVASNLKDAESVGKHFNRNVRNKYEYERLTKGNARRRRKGHK